MIGLRVKAPKRNVQRCLGLWVEMRVVGCRLLRRKINHGKIWRVKFKSQVGTWRSELRRFYEVLGWEKYLLLSIVSNEELEVRCDFFHKKISEMSDKNPGKKWKRDVKKRIQSWVGNLCGSTSFRVSCDCSDKLVLNFDFTRNNKQFKTAEYFMRVMAKVWSDRLFLFFPKLD